MRSERMKVSQLSVFFLCATNEQKQLSDMTPDERRLLGHHVLTKVEEPCLDNKMALKKYNKNIRKVFVGSFILMLKKVIKKVQ